MPYSHDIIMFSNHLSARIPKTILQLGITYWMIMVTRCSCLTLSMTVAHFIPRCLVICVAKLTYVLRTVVLIRRKMDCPSNSVRVDAQQQLQPRRQLQQPPIMIQNVKLLLNIIILLPTWKNPIGKHTSIFIYFGDVQCYEMRSCSHHVAPVLFNYLSARTRKNILLLGITYWMIMVTRCSCLTLSMTVAHSILRCLVICVAKLTYALWTVVLIRRKMDCPSNSVRVDAQQQLQPRRQLQQLRNLLNHAKIIRFHCTGTRRLEMIYYGEFSFHAYRASSIITNCFPHINSSMILFLAQTLLITQKHGVALMQNRNFSTNLQKIAAMITTVSSTCPWMRAIWKIYAPMASR